MNSYRLQWLYNILEELQEQPTSTSASVYNQIQAKIRSLQRDDDRTSLLEEYLAAMFYVYVETLDEQVRWRNDPDDINGECIIFYTERECFLKHLISVAADIKKICHVEISGEFIEQWRRHTSKSGNKLPDEEVQKIVPLATSNRTNEAVQIPTELQSSEAQALLNRAVEAGLCKPDGQGRYKWLVKDVEIKSCAYFGAKMSKRLHLSKKPKAEGEGCRVNWKPFVTLFGYTANQLKSALAGYYNIGVGEMGKTIIKTIDSIFEAKN